MQRELAAKRGREARANGGGGGGGRSDAPWLQTGIIVKVRSAPRRAHELAWSQHDAPLSYVHIVDMMQSGGNHIRDGACTRALRGQVMSKELAEHGYYKQKGEVGKLVSKYVAQVSMLGSGDLLQARHAVPACARSGPWFCVSSALCVGGGQAWATFCLQVLSALTRAG